jgi:hypothetical protein
MATYNNALTNQPANRLAFPSSIGPVPRNEYLGALSDFLAKSYSPERTQQMQGISQLLGLPAVSRTLDMMSYGDPLTTGAGGLGGTTRVKPDVLEAAMTVAPLGKPATMATLQAARLARQAAMATGKFVAPKAGQLTEGYMQRMGMMPSIVPPSGRSGFGAFDPRYDPRVLEQPRLQSMTRDIQLNPNVQTAPTVSLADFEGRPFITSMADRTAAGGKLVGIDNVPFNRPVELLGGQDFMFNNPGLVWSSGNAPSKALMKYADEIKNVTGQNPLYVPYRMAPTGGDFAQMTGETMLSYADAAMNKTQKNKFDKSIKKFIPDWAGVSDPTSVAQFRAAPDSKRKAIKQMMDRDFRDEGGLNIGGARLAVSDPAQLAAQEGGIQNVGEIFAGSPILKSSHPAYPGGVQGQGIGTLAEDRNIFELLPGVVKARNIPDPKNPRASDLRAMQMHPYAGIITNELLKSLGY